MLEQEGPRRLGYATAFAVRGLGVGFTAPDRADFKKASAAPPLIPKRTSGFIFFRKEESRVVYFLAEDYFDFDFLYFFPPVFDRDRV